MLEMYLKETEKIQRYNKIIHQIADYDKNFKII